jgi:hypothetical protein
VIVVRSERDMLELLKEETSNFRDGKGEFREPDRCPYCDSLLVPSISPHGRARLTCMECEQED